MNNINKQIKKHLNKSFVRNKIIRVQEFIDKYNQNNINYIHRIKHKYINTKKLIINEQITIITYIRRRRKEIKKEKLECIIKDSKIKRINDTHK